MSPAGGDPVRCGVAGRVTPQLRPAGGSDVSVPPASFAPAGAVFPPARGGAWGRRSHQLVAPPRSPAGRPQVDRMDWTRPISSPQTMFLALCCGARDRSAVVRLVAIEVPEDCTPGPALPPPLDTRRPGPLWKEAGRSLRRTSFSIRSTQQQRCRRHGTLNFLHEPLEQLCGSQDFPGESSRPGAPASRTGTHPLELAPTPDAVPGFGVRGSLVSSVQPRIGDLVILCTPPSRVYTPRIRRVPAMEGRMTNGPRCRSGASSSRVLLAPSCSWPFGGSGPRSWARIEREVLFRRQEVA